MNNENMNNGLNQFGQEMNYNNVQGNIQPTQNIPVNQGQSVQNTNPVMQGQPMQNMSVPTQVESSDNNIDPNMNVSQNIQPENINPNIDPNSINQEQAQYGFNNNEEKLNLNDEQKSNMKFVIILAILMLAFIILLPYLSNLL